MPGEKLTLTVSETAAKIGISKITVYELARSEHFPAVKIGRRIVIPKAALERWLEAEAWRKKEA